MVQSLSKLSVPVVVQCLRSSDSSIRRGVNILGILMVILYVVNLAIKLGKTSMRTFCKTSSGADRIMFVLHVIVIAVTLGGVAAGVVNSVDATQSFDYLFFNGIFNVYVYVLAYAYLPLEEVDADKLDMEDDDDGPTSLNNLTGGDDVGHHGDRTSPPGRGVSTSPTGPHSSRPLSPSRATARPRQTRRFVDEDLDGVNDGGGDDGDRFEVGTDDEDDQDVSALRQTDAIDLDDVPLHEPEVVLSTSGAQDTVDMRALTPQHAPPMRSGSAASETRAASASKPSSPSTPPVSSYPALAPPPSGASPGPAISSTPPVPARRRISRSRLSSPGGRGVASPLADAVDTGDVAESDEQHGAASAGLDDGLDVMFGAAPETHGITGDDDDEDAAL